MVYIEHIKNSFRTQFRYRLNWGMKVFGTVISVFGQICLWNALLVNRESVLDMEYMIGYVLASAMIQSLVMGRTIDNVNREIYTGQIAMNVIKPICFKWYIFCESLGGSFFSFLFRYLPVTIVMTIIYDVYEVWKGIDIWFVFSVLIGIYLYFSVSYCLAMSSFWTSQTIVIGRFMDDFTRFFSGQWVPIVLLPGFLLKVSRFLPFQYIYYTPISILLNDLTLQDKIYSIGVQIGWCILFTVLGNCVEHKGMRKLQVQGGVMMRTNMIGKIKLFIELWKMLFKSKAEYRINFFMEIFINIFTYAVTYLQIWVIVRSFGDISGWNFYELMLLFNFNLFSYGFACIILFFPMRELETLVHSGDFDGVLVKPMNPFVYMLLRQSYIGFFGHVILATTIFVIAFKQLAIPFNIGIFLDIVVKLIGAILIQGAIIIFTGALCFKFVRSITVMDVCIYNVREFIKYPISIYSTGIQIFLTVIIPYGFVNFYPVEALLGKKQNFLPLWIADVGGIVIGIVLIILSYKFFMRYVNKYQSTGS